jgi:hypothetical protein
VAVNARKLLLIGAALTVLGMALAATVPVVMGDSGAARLRQQAGGVLVVIGWSALVWGIHRFGRSSES